MWLSSSFLILLIAKIGLWTKKINKTVVYRSEVAASKGVILHPRWVALRITPRSNSQTVEWISPLLQSPGGILPKQLVQCSGLWCYCTYITHRQTATWPCDHSDHSSIYPWWKMDLFPSQSPFSHWALFQSQSLKCFISLPAVSPVRQVTRAPVYLPSQRSAAGVPEDSHRKALHVIGLLRNRTVIKWFVFPTFIQVLL